MEKVATVRLENINHIGKNTLFDTNVEYLEVISAVAIERRAFNNNEYLKSVTFENVKRISANVLDGCNNLVFLRVYNDGLESYIDNAAFNGIPTENITLCLSVVEFQNADILRKIWNNKKWYQILKITGNDANE